MISRKKFQVEIQTIIFLHHIEKVISFGLQELRDKGKYGAWLTK